MAYNGNHQFFMLHIHYFLICCIFSKVKRKVEKYSQDTQTSMKLMRQAGRAIKYLNKSFTGQDKVTNFPSLFKQPQ